jgi:hypothetical protein
MIGGGACAALGLLIVAVSVARRRRMVSEGAPAVAEKSPAPGTNRLSRFFVLGFVPALTLSVLAALQGVGRDPAHIPMSEAVKGQAWEAWGFALLLGWIVSDALASGRPLRCGARALLLLLPIAADPVIWDIRDHRPITLFSDCGFVLPIVALSVVLGAISWGVQRARWARKPRTGE